ncbi:MAG: sulfate permease [Gemmatimonadales bacterium]|nr:sulfate permease [Gemmatimonadales bacterium]
MLVPKLLTTLKSYSGKQFRDDLQAGVIVGIVALPLAIAFAIASGVSPERGLYTAIIAGFLISLLGGSRVQIGGPTGAFVVIVAGIVQRYGLDGLTVATIMAGIALIGLGLAKLGGVIKFIPFPVISGFTAGIAVVIFSTQVKDLLGLQVDQVPPEFFGKWVEYLRHLGTTDPATVAIAGGTLAILIWWPRISLRIPAPFVALLAGTVAVQLLDLPVETIGSRFGPIDASLPSPVFPRVTEAMIVSLAGPALTIALLAAIESLLSAVVADGMIGSRHRSNMELVAQGAANIVAPLFGGMPATGAIARTATNVKNGGRTPVAGIVHALTLLTITLFFGRWAALIPLASLAAILTVVAYHMSEWRTVRAEIRGERSDAAVLLTTLVLTVFVDLTVAIAVGMVLAAFLFMKRMAETTSVAAISESLREAKQEQGEDAAVARHARVPRDVEVYDINGPFFFGAAEKFRDALSQVSRRPRALILDMEKVPVIDSTGLRALTAVVHQCRRDGVRVLLTDLAPATRARIADSELGRSFGPSELDLTFDAALFSLGPTGEMPAKTSAG